MTNNSAAPSQRAREIAYDIADWVALRGTGTHDMIREGGVARIIDAAIAQGRADERAAVCEWYNRIGWQIDEYEVPVAIARGDHVGGSNE